ncbi:hypothetical protein AAFC00_005785 [Neodothiora populina]|uniref:Malic acid transport protein n=1 Tax=Neodothiora populina TaxID=2781224 RepID=A0ABR3P647_9PEZI
MFANGATRRRANTLPNSSNCSSDETLDKDIRDVEEGRTQKAEKKIWAEKEGDDRYITLKERLRHFTWAWFTLTMSTGGFSLLLSVQPHKFRKLMTLGTIVYIFDLVLFVSLCTAMITRFILYPSSLRRSLTYPNESLFFPTFWLSFPTIIGGMQNYGGDKVGDWLPVVLRVLYWIYCACTTLVAILQYWYLFTAKQLTVQAMAPSWILPIFPAMLCGTLASIVAKTQPYDQRMPIIVSGIAFQGLGMTVSICMYAVLIARLMEYGLPPPNARPGMFICVGPPSFTALALIGMSKALPEGYSYFEDNPTAIVAVKALAVFTAIFLWALSFWWFAIAFISVLYGIKEMSFHLVWWAFVFPNTGFTIATIDIGEQLKSQGIQWVGSIMSILIFAMWTFVIVNHIRALVTKRMMMPGMDEDKGNETDPVVADYQSGRRAN